MRVDKLIPALAEEDYEKDEKQRTVTLTEAGQEKMERLLREAGLLETGTLYDIHNVSLVHHGNQALRAHKLFARDTDYIVKDDKIVIIDEFTGRMMEGRRYSEGLHQALEAKEGVTVQNENQTLASITFQNYFRMYPKLAGMTGTAMTEAVYRSTREKYDAVVEQVLECQGRQQPVLLGTVSIEKSEALAELFKNKKIPHNVLNARYHEQEASIIAQAGRPGAVTIATNMAGRGTDIQLGGNLEMRLKADLAAIEDPAGREVRAAEIRAEIEAAREVVRQAGGLFVVGSERHESRRIDNQLRGRSGRQGDPGASKFFVSLQDDLMRIFGSERMDSMLQRLGLKEGEAIIHPWVNKALAKAQQKVEARNYDIRKQLLKFDDVMNDQRKVVYEQRRDIMSAVDVSETVADMRYETIAEMVAQAVPENALPEQWDVAGLHAECLRLLALDLPLAEWAKEEGIDKDTVEERIVAAADRKMAEKTANYGPELMRMAEKSLLLQILDQSWKDHLLSLDHLRQAINLRAYAQRDPLNEYKREAFELFEEMLVNLRQQLTSVLSHVELRMEPPPPPSPAFAEYSFGAPGGAEYEPAMAEMEAIGAGAPFGPEPASARGRGARRGNGYGGGSGSGERLAGPRSPWAGTPRNAACPCGSGKKFKHCHGRI
jgi:preprotein translocase subunit SecA